MEISMWYSYSISVNRSSSIGHTEHLRDPSVGNKHAINLWISWLAVQRLWHPQLTVIELFALNWNQRLSVFYIDIVMCFDWSPWNEQTNPSNICYRQFEWHVLTHWIRTWRFLRLFHASVHWRLTLLFHKSMLFLYIPFICTQGRLYDKPRGLLML